MSIVSIDLNVEGSFNKWAAGEEAFLLSQISKQDFDAVKQSDTVLVVGNDVDDSLFYAVDNLLEQGKKVVVARSLAFKNGFNMAAANFDLIRLNNNFAYVQKTAEAVEAVQDDKAFAEAQKNTYVLIHNDFSQI